MKFILIIAAFFASVAFMSPIARAQQTTDARTAEQQTIHDALVLKIETLKHEKIKTFLGLDDATAKQFFEIYKPAEKDIQTIVKERNDDMRKLALLSGSTKSDAEVDQLMDNVHSLNEQITDREQKLENDLKPILSARQRAKLLVFEHEFNQRIREEIRNRVRGNAKLRNLRRELRQQRLKNRLLRKQATEKDVEGH